LPLAVVFFESQPVEVFEVLETYYHLSITHNHSCFCMCIFQWWLPHHCTSNRYQSGCSLCLLRGLDITCHYWVQDASLAIPMSQNLLSSIYSVPQNISFLNFFYVS